MILTNPWIGYIDRTYEQIKANVLTKYQAFVPEITDHTETNPWVKNISIWSGIAEMLGYYIDSEAREAFISTAQEFESGVKAARAVDYRVKGAIPASTTLRFTSNIAATGDILIPAGTQVQTSTGIIYTTTADGTILTGQTTVDIPAKQWEVVSNVALGNSNGNPDQVFVLEEDVADGSVAVTVDAISYTAQETLAYSFSDSEHFVAGLREDTKMTITFGDDVTGKIPPSGNAIVADYYITQGEAGNIGTNRINQLIDTITVPGSEVITVNNLVAATGGADFENLPKLQKRIPYSIRTRYRAVTEQDFIDLTEIFAGVEKAGVSYEDNVVNVYVIPDGGGIASPTLLNDVQTFLDIRKSITTPVETIPAGVINIKITAAIRAIPGHSNATVKDAVEQALLEFFDADNQTINGRVVIGDIYEVIEGTEGVLNSIISLIKPVPFARNVTSPSDLMDWTPDLLAGSTTIQEWLIRFITASTFELYKGINFLGTFSVDTLVSETEIEFTVNGNHTSGHDFIFHTYPYNQSIDLNEPSIPSAELADLSITVTGGV